MAIIPNLVPNSKSILLAFMYKLSWTSKEPHPVCALEWEVEDVVAHEVLTNTFTRARKILLLVNRTKYYPNSGNPSSHLSDNYTCYQQHSVAKKNWHHRSQKQQEQQLLYQVTLWFCAEIYFAETWVAYHVSLIWLNVYYSLSQKLIFWEDILL